MGTPDVLFKKGETIPVNSNASQYLSFASSIVRYQWPEYTKSFTKSTFSAATWSVLTAWFSPNDSVISRWYAHYVTYCYLFYKFTANVVPVVCLQVAFFVHQVTTLPVAGHDGPQQRLPSSRSVISLLVYRSDKQRQLWRFFLYMLVHAGWLSPVHLHIIHRSKSLAFINSCTISMKHKTGQLGRSANFLKILPFTVYNHVLGSFPGYVANKMW